MTTRCRFWLTANFKTGPTILGPKLWLVRRKYKINYGKKLLRYSNPKDDGQGNLVSQLDFQYRYCIFHKHPFSSFRGLRSIWVDLGLQKKSKKI